MAQPVASEYEVKAAFVYNFARFVSWPVEEFRSSEEDFVIGVLGADPFGAVLDDLVESKKVGGSDLAVRRFPSVDALGPCQVLFVTSAENGRLGEVLGMLGESAVLTVGEAEGFLEQGGMINLRLEEQKVRFEINAGAADKAGLKISSQLLKLAIRVVGMPATGDDAP